MAKIKTFRKSTKANLSGVFTSRHIANQKLLEQCSKGAKQSSMSEIMKREKALMLKELAI